MTIRWDGTANFPEVSLGDAVNQLPPPAPRSDSRRKEDAPCPICGSAFWGERGFNRHAVMTHKVPQAMTPVLNWFRCWTGPWSVTHSSSGWKASIGFNVLRPEGGTTGAEVETGWLATPMDAIREAYEQFQTFK